MTRPGLQALLHDAREGAFGVVVCEALNRLSRDHGDIADIHKNLKFAGVRIVTLSEGEIATLKIGMKGTMNALYLEDLAAKTRRGLRGRIEQGKSGGGLAYGYTATKRTTSDGEPVRDEREIDENQARTIRRIFEDYVR